MHQTTVLISDPTVIAFTDKCAIKYTFGANHQNIRLFRKLYCIKY